MVFLNTQQAVSGRELMMEGTSTKENGKGSSRSSSSRKWRGGWTNEMHLRFLNTIEASFVQAMSKNVNYNPHLRLDRHIPDSYESTQDLPLPRPTTSLTSPGNFIYTFIVY